jgi:hypothetical protein
MTTLWGGEGVIYEWALGAGVLKKLRFYLINFSNVFLEWTRKKLSTTTLPLGASIYEWALTLYSNTGGGVVYEWALAVDVAKKVDLSTDKFFLDQFLFSKWRSLSPIWSKIFFCGGWTENIFSQRKSYWTGWLSTVDFLVLTN